MLDAALPSSLLNDNASSSQSGFDAAYAEGEGSIYYKVMTGDVMLVDLGLIAPGSNYEIVRLWLVGKEGQPNESLTQTTTAYGSWQYTSEGLLGAHCIDAGRISDILPFSSTGRFYFAPGTSDGLPGDTNLASPGFQGQIDVEYRVDGQFGRTSIDVAPGYTVNNSYITSVGSARNTLRTQQRLNYLGFPGANGNWLDVDGDVGSANSNTQWAIGLFNAAVQDCPVGQSGCGLVVRSDQVNTEFVNARNAPRWQEMPVGGPGWLNGDAASDNQDWGTSWAVEVVEAAGARLHDLLIETNDVSLPIGGPTPDHLGHQNGRSVDIETASTDRPYSTAHDSLGQFPYSPFYGIRREGNTYYIRARTHDDPNGSRHIIVRDGDGYAARNVSEGFQDALTHSAATYNNAAVLGSIRDLIVDNRDAGYQVGTVKQQIRAFQDITTASGATVRDIFYNDPRTWNIEGLPNDFVRFSNAHGGHFHVNVDSPQSAFYGDFYLNAFDEGFIQFERWAERYINSETNLGRRLPLVNDELKALVDLPGLLHEILVAQIGRYDSFDGLVQRLNFSNAHLTSHAVAVPSSVAGELLVSIDFTAQRQKAAPFWLGLPAELQLAVSGTPLNLQAEIQGRITLGVNPQTHEFFLVTDGTESPEFSIHSWLSDTISETGGWVDFLSVLLGNGQASLLYDATIDLDGGPGQRITLAEMKQGGPAAVEQIIFSPTGSAHTEFRLQSDVPKPFSPVSFSAGAVSSNEQGVFYANWDDLANPTFVNTNAADFSYLKSFSKVTATAFSFGFEQLASYFVGLAQDALGGINPLSGRLPIVNRSLAEILDFPRFFSEALTQHTGVTTDEITGLQVVPFQHSDGLRELLGSLPGVGPENVSYTITADDVRYTLHLEKAVQQSLPLDVNLASKIDLSLSGTVDVGLDTALDLTFGVNRHSGLFFIRADDTPIFTLAGSVAADIDLATRLGLLDVTITDGRAQLSAGLSVTLSDPETDNPTGDDPLLGFDPPPSPGAITSSELVTGSLAAMSSVTLSGSAGLALPLTGSLAGFSESGTLTIAWPDITRATAFSLDTSQIAGLFRFHSLTAQNILDGLLALPDVLNRLGSAQLFGRRLPFIGGDMGQLIKLGDKVAGYLTELPSFQTARGLEQALESVLSSPGHPADVLVEVTGSDVQFVIQFRQEILDERVHYSVGAGLNSSNGGLGFQASGDVSVSGAADVRLRFGLAFGPDVDPLDRFYILPGSDSHAGLAFKLDAGGLSATASLGLTTVGIENGTAKIAGRTGGQLDPSKDATFRLVFSDPGSGAAADNKITLREIISNPAALLPSPLIDGAVEVLLPLVRLPGSTTDPYVELKWTDMARLDSLSVTSADLDSYLAAAFAFDGEGALEGVGTVLEMIGGWTNSQLLKTKLPFVNKTIPEVFDFVDEIAVIFRVIQGQGTPEDGVDFDRVVTEAIANADLLHREGVSLTPNPNHDDSQHNPAENRFRYLLEYDYDVVSGSYPFDFAGLFTLDAVRVEPTVQFRAQLEFGLDAENGFYLVNRGSGDAAEISLSVGVDLNFERVQGKFGPLAIGVTCTPGDPRPCGARIGSRLTLDLGDPDAAAGARIPAGELFGDLDFQLFTADLRMPMGAKIGEDGPGIVTEFTAHWSLEDPTRPTFGPNGSTNPADGFGPVKYELGEFVRRLIGPVLQKIKAYNPLSQDVVDVMLTPLPVIGVTPLNLLIQLGDLPREVELLFKVATIVNSLPSDGRAVDLSAYLGGSPPAGDEGNEGSENGGSVLDSLRQFVEMLRDEYQVELPVLALDEEGNFRVADSIINIMLGGDVDLIRWNPPAFHFKKDLTPPPIPLGVYFGIIVQLEYGASFGFFGDFDIGLSSRGLRDNDGDGRIDLLDGFYIGDNHVRGTDQFESGFSAEVFVGLSASALGILEIYGRGGIRGTIGLDLADVLYDADGGMTRVGRNDTGGDGRIYLDDITALQKMGYGASCILTLGGQLDLFARMGIEISLFLFSIDIPIFEITKTLVSWDLPCAFRETDLAQVQSNSLVMHTDATLAGRQLSISVERDDAGAAKGLRISRSTDSGIEFESFSLSDASSPNYIGHVTTLVVEGSEGPDAIVFDPKITEVSGIQHIQVHAGSGDDQVSFGTIRANQSRLLGTTIYAGAGNDQIEGTFAADLIYGGDGDDVIVAGNGNDTIYGGAGADVINAGEGSNLVYGEGGDDRLSAAGDGQNTLVGGDGHDQLVGAEGDDWLDGGSGMDLLIGSGGNDQIHGGPDADQVFAGPGNDSIYGQGGSDELHGDAGDDYIDAGDGRDRVFGDSGEDTIHGGEGNDTLDGGPGNDRVFGGLGDDLLKGGLGDDLLDGQQDNDRYDITLLGGTTSSRIKVADTGANQADTDVLAVTGTMRDDQFLLRASTLPTGLAFVAMINQQGNAERIDYDGVERMLVMGSGGNDRFAVDDSRAATTLDGGTGNDFFQIGQLYKSRRTQEDANLDLGDVFEPTTETTRGFLSNGNSRPMTVFGGPGNDEFVVFHNRAHLTLNGDEGDDAFSIRAFALAGSQDSKRDRTDVSGGAGADLIQYAINAPVSIDGGDGLDTVIVTGTEFGDDFVVTNRGVYGAGLNVSFVNVEALKVDGAEGDDRFFVLSTSDELITIIAGGLGSDTFSIAGETPPVVSNDLLGHSGIILHTAESADADYDGANIGGISVNVADNDEPGIVITQSEGSTVVVEGGRTDSYTIVLTRQPGADVLVSAAAPLRTEDDEKRGVKSFRVSSTAPGAKNNPAANTVVLTFTKTNWFIPQTVNVDALGNTDELLNYDDTAVDRRSGGVITHTVTVVKGDHGFPADAFFGSPSAVTNEALTDLSAAFPTDGQGLRGGWLQIVDGPGMGEQRLILSNTSDTLTLHGRWREQPTAASQYLIQRYDQLPAPSVTVQVIDNDASGLIVVEADATTPADGDSDGSTHVVEGGASDKLEISLARRPLAAVSVRLDGGDQLTLSADQLTFDASNWDLPQVVTVSALNDTVREGFHHGLITISSTSAGDPGYNGLVARPIVVSIADDDVSQVLIRETLQSTNVIEGGVASDDSPWTDAYTVVLTRQPAADVTVRVLPQITKATKSVIRNDLVQVRVFSTAPAAVNNADGSVALLFTPLNWDQPQTVTVLAIDDQIVDGGDTKVFAPGSHTLDGIQGPLVVQGAAGTGSLNVGEPVLFPGETNIRRATGHTVAVGANSLTAATDDLLAVEDVGQLDDLIHKTVEITEGPGSGQIRLIIGVEAQNPPTTILLRLNENWNLTAEQLGQVTKYAITDMSPNFFAKEEEQVDYLTLFHDDSLADSVGTLGRSRISGFGMGQDRIIAGRLTPGGITYEQLEVVEVKLGAGHDRVTINGTQTREDGYQTWTLVRTGAGNDSVNVSLHQAPAIVASGTAESGSAATLTDAQAAFPTAGLGLQGYRIHLVAGRGAGQQRTVLSNTAHTITVSAAWEIPPDATSRYEVVRDADGALALSTEQGDDVVDASGSDRPLIIFGDEGSDTLTGGRGTDMIFGDLGRVDYWDETGAVVTRLGTPPDLDGRTAAREVEFFSTVTYVTAMTLSDAAACYPLGNEGLTGLFVRITNGTGALQRRRIVSNTATTLFLDQPWDVLPDTTSTYRLYALPENQTDGVVRDPRFLLTVSTTAGGADHLHGGDGDDLLMGGFAADVIHGDDGADLIYGHGIHGGNDDAAGDFLYGDDGPDEIYGQDGDDLIFGGDAPDQLFGGAGDDTIHGNLGDDHIRGGAGNDAILGDEGYDRLFGEDGNDLIHGDAGNDYLDGGAGVDTLRGGLHDDVLFAGTGLGNVLYGDEGDDRIFSADEGGPDPDFSDLVHFGDLIFGGPGRDSIWGLGGADVIDGGDDADFIDGGFHGNFIHGGAGDDEIYAGSGDGNQVFGDAGADLIFGSHLGNDAIYGGTGNDTIHGQAGNDWLAGDEDDDWIDGGVGRDTLIGGPGNDELLGGGGVGDSLDGGTGDDLLRGSDDGADFLAGGPGRDRLLGNGGNDWLTGGDDDDILDGGAGDDTISGDGGSDLLLGGADHDVLYGHNLTGAGDDFAVDYVYGDFGTNRDEPGSGRDRVFGGGGNDVLFGEGDDDFIDTGTGTDDRFNYGTGETANPADFAPPTPTPAPSPGAAPSPVDLGAASLPTGIDFGGRWRGLAASANAAGLSGDPGLSLEPSVIAATDTRYVAWSDSRNGNFEVYVARHTNGRWGQLAGSAEQGGVSATIGSSRRPALTLNALGQPIVAWTEYTGAGSDIRVAIYDPASNGGGWIALGNSLAPGGISVTGKADQAAIVSTTSGPVVAWLDHSSGTAQIYAKRFSGGSWQSLGTGAASDGGVSAAGSDVRDLAIATDGEKVAVAWSAQVGEMRQVFLKEFTDSWHELGGSATGTGLSATPYDSDSPSIAYLDGTLYAA